MMSVPLSEGGGAVDAVLTMLRKLRYRGIFSCEMKRDQRDGALKLLEVNARPWWYVEFAAFCGVNVVEMAYLDALGIRIPEVDSYLEGRRLIHPYFDIQACREERGSLLRGGLTWTRSLVGADQPIFQWDDPRPGVSEAFRLAGGYLGRRIGRFRRGD
jgi:predicted ATP-grasp superfamily ATP-dependent carboligase